MSQIISGSMTFGQTLNTGDYNSRKAEAMFAFTLDVGDNASTVADMAGALAKAKVIEMLGISKPAVVAATADAAPATTAVTKPKAAKAKKEDAPAPKPATDPTDMTEGTPLSEVRQISNGTEDRVDPTQVTDEWSGATVVTDKELQDACSKKKAELGVNLGPLAAQRIMKLIGTFIGGKPLNTMPADVRAAFVAKLTAMKPDDKE